MKRSKEYLKSFVDKIIMETLSEKADKVMGKLKNAPSSFDYVEDIDLELDEATMEDEKGNVVKPGMSGMTNEDECNECGTMYEIELDEDETCECGGSIYEGECMECGMKSMGGEEILEFGSGKSDFTAGMFEEDSELEEGETEEGNAFTGMLKKTPKGGSFKLGGKEYKDRSSLEETLYRLVDGDDSALFTESEIIDIIENIVLEEKKKESNIKKGVTPRGLEAYNKAHKGSGKENKQYLESVAKKMTDYIKDGSKQKKYENNPKHFPKGNGELGEMEKMAYEIDDEGKDFNFEVSGLNIPDYDENKPKKETIEKQIKGSSTNGNDPGYANAVDTGVNDKFAEYFENDQLAKWKDQSYKRVPSPVYDEEPNGGKKKAKLKEEFDRMKNLISYDRKTQ